MAHTFRPIPAARLKLLIFDLDGTLVDSRQDLANSINAMLVNYHRPELPADVIATYIGDGAPTLVRRSMGFKDDHDLAPREEECIEDALVFFLEYYREHKLDNTRCYDGVLEALMSVSRDDRTLTVLSNKPVNPSRAIVNHLGMGPMFRAVYGGNSFETKKPDPLGVQILLREFGAGPEETVIVGDSDIDIITARNAGIYSIGCSYGLAPESLGEAPPDVLVSSAAEWAEVLTLIDR
ncbi:MAG: HAD hydrolase-like protein [Acidobacteriales bacterium]|nr:HAD hydrolase-like protein [Terriglobales bacterium]